MDNPQEVTPSEVPPSLSYNTKMRAAIFLGACVALEATRLTIGPVAGVEEYRWVSNTYDILASSLILIASARVYWWLFRNPSRYKS